MRDLHLRGLRIRLLRGGVAPRHVNRTLKELRHHFADLEQQALSQGLSQREASAQAAERIGDPELVIDETLARPELRSWAYRWPWGIYGILPVIAMALVIVGSMFAVFWFFGVGPEPLRLERCGRLQEPCTINRGYEPCLRSGQWSWFLSCRASSLAHFVFSPRTDMRRSYGQQSAFF